MRRITRNLKSGFKTIILTFVFTSLLTSCTEVIKVIDFLGVIPPREAEIHLSLEEQQAGTPFTIADYCKEEYDSIFLYSSIMNSWLKGKMQCFSDSLVTKSALILSTSLQAFTLSPFINSSVQKVSKLMLLSQMFFNCYIQSPKAVVNTLLVEMYSILFTLTNKTRG